MAVQARGDTVNHNFLARGMGTYREAQTILQDAGRGAADMVRYTLMSQVPASRKWVPFTNAAAVDGTEKPTGILLETVAAADIVAGDVNGITILVSGTILDEDQLVIENSLTLDTVITSEAQTVRTYLRRGQFQFSAGSAASRVENA